MNSNISTLVAIGTLVARALFSERTNATAINLTDFSDTSNLQMNGGAATVPTSDGQVLRLTPASPDQSGSAFLKRSVSLGNDASFSTYFEFRMSNPGGSSDSDGPGADGLVFVLQPIANNILDGSGGSIDYGNIKPSVGIELDTYDNGFPPDVNGNHVGVDLNGSLSSVASTPIPDRLNNGNSWYAWVDYDGTTQNLQVRLSESSVRPISPTLSSNTDVATVLGSTDIFPGFMSATGGGWENHDILSWVFVDNFEPIGTSDVPEVSSTLALLGLGLAALGAVKGRCVLA
jgi:hypothetical protein